MKNVIVVALGGARYAIELRWVREIFTLGPITPVPKTPPEIAGVVNFRGAIVPVLSLARLAGSGHTPTVPRATDGAVLVEVEGVHAAIAMDNVDAVCTLEDAPSEPDESLLQPALLDAHGHRVRLLSPPELIKAAAVRVSHVIQTEVPARA